MDRDRDRDTDVAVPMLHQGDRVRITSENLHERTPRTGIYLGPRYGQCAVLLDGTQTTLVFSRRELEPEAAQ